MTSYALAERDVVSAAAGDREAFVRLVEAYANMVTGIALAIVRDLHASQDIAQEVFLVAWRDVQKLRNPASFLPWVRQITRNRANQWLRDQKLEVTERDADSILAAAIDHRPTAPELLERDEQQRIVEEVIESLPEEAREVITLYYKEGRSVRQVSELLDLSEEAVKKRLSRARERIREDLLERFGETIRVAAPAAAILTAIGSSLTIAGPSAAAATGAATKFAGGSLLVKLAALVGGSLLGASLGSLGFGIGLRKNLALAVDAQERRELKRFALFGMAVCTLAAFGFGLAGKANSATLLIVTQLLFIASCVWMHLRWLPRILQRRVAAEIAGDPGAAARIRRDRLRGWVFMLVGISISTATVVFVLIKSGMLRS